MGKREGDHIDVTVAVAMVDEHVPDLDADFSVSDVRAFVLTSRTSTPTET